MNLRVLATGVLAALLGGCADNNVSVQLFQICVPPTDPTVCEFPAECAAGWGGEVVLDLAYSEHLYVPIQVNNQLANNRDTSTGRGNTHDANITEFVTTFSPALPETVTAGQYVVPASGTSTASVRAKGTYADQSTFETAEFKIPLIICFECIAPCGRDPATGVALPFSAP